ncbi:hypothetical protein ElyMa_002975600 [Elysia marginata]|uniref:Uncharacterized protein n=1 Tax=Elysia marginata TaxID=1093978 RepID=A0AAV4IA28_9GAST|nr:hypothetical protein ElyMa_002975600 [Elysia marginata]
MEVIDLGDPATFRRLATADDSSSENQQALSSSSPEPPFIAELYQASNASDTESDDEEFFAHKTETCPPCFSSTFRAG